MTQAYIGKTTRARRAIAAVLVFVTLPVLLLASFTGQPPQPKAPRENVPEIKPQIPTTKRNGAKRVFLEHADELTRADGDSFMVLTGNVEFSKGAMLMFCDSAHYYDASESIDAFGNVRMRQGDTLFVYADELNYRGGRNIAFLYGTPGHPVRMINRDVTLTTPTFIYDLRWEYGYYNEGGDLTDKQNKLTSIEGEYFPNTKEANFYSDVHLTSLSESDTLDIYTDTLYYNTNTHLAELTSPSTIISKDATIYTDNGTYNTESAVAELFNRSRVVASTGTILEGDTLYYDRTLGQGEVYGNMMIDDSTHCMILTGDYGYYNELTDSAFATGHALAREYSQGDTLYLHSRYLYSYAVLDSINVAADTVAGTEAYVRVDTSYVMVAHPRVRFYRSDMQGLCDSMRFEQRDSMLYMYHHPVVWSGERQIFGNVINLHLNDSTIDRAHLPEFAFTAEQIEGTYYNQLAGKEMIAYFVDGDLRQLDVNGNVQAIMLPQEDDSTYNKIVNVESSFMTANFLNRQILRMKMWPETNGTVTPLYLAKKSLFFLPQFKWYTPMRPNSPEDVFVIPAEMDELMADIPSYPVTLPPRLMKPEDTPEDEIEGATEDENVDISNENAEATDEVDEDTTGRGRPSPQSVDKPTQQTVVSFDSYESSVSPDKTNNPDNTTEP